ncbi:hypothetical protein AVEN_225598-1 [Araneus ventricosus]|uniref:Uncharacterized protein n=1 Tax=Araneus ventricosus TaxID=182803 RepID=A0A4Y2EXU8_ARAVE|nr:hypothetical protein AVEN_225598-1 [Araneus ventricosus]
MDFKRSRISKLLDSTIPIPNGFSIDDLFWRCAVEFTWSGVIVNAQHKLASRSEKTEFSRDYDRCISCNATRAKSQELKYFRFSKDEERCLIDIFSLGEANDHPTPVDFLHRTRMLLAELMFAMCGNANYEPDDDIILESTQIIRKRMKIA